MIRLLVVIILIIIICKMCSSCNTSEGLKYGTLQKVSHKTFPCDYYVAEFSFEGGRVTGSDDSRAYSNTQEIAINKLAFDSLQTHLGDKVVFDYKDEGLSVCEPSKKLTSIKWK